jgi:hypothetical protein
MASGKLPATPLRSCSFTGVKSPFHSLTPKKGSSVSLVNLVDRANVRVVKGGCSLRLPLEAAESLSVVG